MSTNLYGPDDKYHPENSHVLSALIRRLHETAEAEAMRVMCRCCGLSLQEFLHVDDLGEVCVFALEHWQSCPEELQFFNINTGVDPWIRDLAEMEAQSTGFAGDSRWDPSKSYGTPKKQLNVSRFAALGWRSRIPREVGLPLTIDDYRRRLKRSTPEPALRTTP